MPFSGSESGALDAELRRALRAGAAIDVPELARRYALSIEAVEDCLAAARALGRVIEAGAEETRPSRIGRYQVQGPLGRGGMGQVFRATDPRLGRAVAIKMLSGASASPSQLRRFRDEARAMARVQHPNVVGILEFGEDEGRPFIAMELIEGEPLSATLAREGALEPRRAAALVRDLARGLERVHGLGILHRDIKPQNILLCDDGRPLLGDFGLARLDGARTSASTRGAFLGTYGYAAPEQVLGRGVDERADIYALGVTLYRALTGAHPFAFCLAATVQAEDYLAAIRGERPRPLAALRPDLAAEQALESICRRCLAREPEERYPSAADLAEDLDRALSGEALAAPRRGLSVFGIGLLIGLLFGLLIGAVIAFSLLA